MSNDGVIAVERALSILDCFERGSEKLTLAELSQKIPLHKTTIYRLLNSLVRCQYVVRDSHARYSLGPRVLYLGRVYESSFELAEVVMPVLEELSRATGESAAYYIDSGEAGKRLCLLRHQPHEGLHSRVLAGTVMAPDDSSTGLVFKKWSHLQEACGDPLPYFSSGVRDPYTSSWSVPVIGSEDQFVGALTIAGPTERLLKADAALFEWAIMSGAKNLSTRLGASHEMREMMYQPPEQSTLKS